MIWPALRGRNECLPVCSIFHLMADFETKQTPFRTIALPIQRGEVESNGEKTTTLEMGNC